MDALDPRHGTYSGAQAHIRAKTLLDCAPCHQAHLRYRRRRRYDVSNGRPRIVDTAPVVQHLRALRENGVAVRDIAAISGVSTSLIDELLNRARPVVRADNAAALLLSRPAPTSTGMVAALGTLRRVRALARLGWSMRQIGDVAGVKFETLRRISSQEPPHVEVATAEGVSAAYEKLSMTLAPPSRTASQVRSKAEHKGWLPPLMFDDIDNDPEPPTPLYSGPDIDPVVVMRLLEGHRIKANHAEREEAIKQWVADGGTKTELCNIHGWAPGRYQVGLRLVQGGAA
jgi:lambda repressor-like predicted transcriptional regulator